ncbi:MAG: hypothetical protein V1792_09735 [Pseudomonadota bacterium]
MEAVRRIERDQHRPFGPYLPWHLLLLVKWTLLYGEPNGGTYPPISFGRAELEDILGAIDNLERRIEDPIANTRGEREWFLYFRKLAFKQFPFQQSIHRSSLGRQSLLFGHLDRDDTISRMFRDTTGIDLTDFVELEVALLVRFYWQKERYIEASWFGNLAKGYAPDAVRRFLEELAKDFQSARLYLTELRKLHLPEIRYELAEMSPLKRFPLLRSHGKYYCYSVHVLYQFLEHGIYEILKSAYGQAFGNDFGKRLFEKYVGRAVNHLGLQVLTEDDLLRARFPKTKVVDFLVVDGDTQIYIDAKAVEMTYIGEVSEDINLILQRIGSSVLKGIHQAYSLAEALHEVENIGKVHVSKSATKFLLIIAYKELYLGGGRDFYECIGREAVDDLVRDKHGGNQTIPFDHMYFISVEDFELLAEAVHQQRIGLAECLKKAVLADSTPWFDGRKLVFRMHLREMLGNLGMPKYVDDEFDAVAHRVGGKFPRK